jgi:quinol monooxygenase YgiN
MLLRIVRGRVLEGRENSFVELSRRQVAEGARSPGLLTFMGGYRRVGGTDEFVLISTWESEEAARQTAGGERSPRAAQILEGTAVIERVESYTLRPPVFRGILDAPGAVIRVSEARIRPGKRDALYSWLEQQDRTMRTTRLLLGWALGEREVDGEYLVAAVSAWPSPLMIEALAEPGRQDRSLFAAVDEFVEDITLVQYQALELELPTQLADVGSRRVVAARFDSETDAQKARDALSSNAESANEAGISVARLASDLRPPEERADHHVLVARVSLADYPQAERLIADHGGQVILAADEKPPPSAAVVQ